MQETDNSIKKFQFNIKFHFSKSTAHLAGAQAVRDRDG